MISPMKLIKMVRKWRKMAALNRRRIPLTRNYKDIENEYKSYTTTSFVVSKGHFVVYTTDERRFVMPLAYLKHDILRQLFKMSEEEFGLSTDRPITLPCDAVFMEYLVMLVQRGMPKDLEKALLRSIDNSLRSSSFHQGVLASQQ